MLKVQAQCQHGSHRGAQRSGAPVHLRSPVVHVTGVIFQNRQVYVRNQFKQCAVLRNFLLVHRRHSLRKVFPNIISRDGVRHDVMPPVNITWSVEKPVLSGGKNLRFVIWTGEWLKPVLSGTNSEPLRHEGKLRGAKNSL
jgi:hypothetical protein